MFYYILLWMHDICMFAFVVFVLVFSTKPIDWLGRTSPT